MPSGLVMDGTDEVWASPYVEPMLTEVPPPDAPWARYRRVGQATAVRLRRGRSWPG